ncbi:MAG: TetR/AcrR family transcriptional regulator [Pseudomonadota bacterium]
MIQEKKNYHHGDLREQLIEAVTQLVEEDGPDGWSIAEACRRAGVSTAAPYRHFQDRHDLLRHTVLRAMDRFFERMQTAADSFPAGDARRIVALGKAYLSFARDEPGIFRIMFSLTEPLEGHADVDALNTDAKFLLDRVVAAHLNIPVESEQTRARAMALWCFVHGYSFLQIDAKSKAEAHAVPEDMLLYLVGEAIVPSDSSVNSDE